MADSKISDLTDGAPAVGTDEVPISRTADVATRKLTLSVIATLFKSLLENGGSAELDLTGLEGLLNTAQTPAAHKTSHENSGSDEIDVTGLSGLLADAQTPLTENVQDIAGAMATDSGTIDFTYDDGAGTLTAVVKASSITEAMQLLADNTTNNASTSAHGYLKKLSNVSTEFMNGQGDWATPTGSSGPTLVTLVGDVTMPSVSASYADITGLTFTPAANKWYLIEFFILWESDTAGIGANFAVNGPTSPTSVSGHGRTPTSATSIVDGNFVGYDAGITSTATLAGVNLALMVVLFKNGSNATAFVGRHKLETGTAAVHTVKAGSTLRYTLLN